MTKPELVALSLELQRELATDPKPNELSADEIEKKADTATQMMEKGVVKLMKVRADFVSESV